MSMYLDPESGKLKPRKQKKENEIKTNFGEPPRKIPTGSLSGSLYNKPAPKWVRKMRKESPDDGKLKPADPEDNVDTKCKPIIPAYLSQPDPEVSAVMLAKGYAKIHAGGDEEPDPWHEISAHFAMPHRRK